jgi:hypothetical protein
MQTLYQSRMELWRLRWQHQQPTQTVEVSSPQQVPPERFGMVVVGTPADIRRASRQASGGLLSRIFGWFR